MARAAAGYLDKHAENPIDAELRNLNTAERAAQG
jgi:hypothetical protein